MELLDPLKEFMEKPSPSEVSLYFPGWLVVPVSRSYTVKGSVSLVEGSSHKETHSSSDTMFCALLSCSGKHYSNPSIVSLV